MSPDPTLDRRIPLEAVHNFRDLGGYATVDGRTTAWRRLYRADGLNRLTTDDVETIRPLGLRTVIDLRTDSELEEHGTFPVDDHPVTFHHLPIIDRTWGPEVREEAEHMEVHTFLLHRYLEMFGMGEHRIADAIRLLAEPGALPAVFHCAAGKDRTGILAAMILGLLGVPDAVIAHDYGLSHEAMERLVAWFRATNPDAIADRADDTPAAFFAAHPDAMLGLLDIIRLVHGSVGAYLATLGVDAATVDALRAGLLDD